MNILNRDNAQFQAVDDIVDLSRAYLNMKGANFMVRQPTVNITFKSKTAIVTKMYAQANSPTYPSNIGQICVTLFGDDLARLTYPNKTIIPTLISPVNSPVIEGWFEGVTRIVVQLCNTTDGASPKGFRFAVVGCYSSIATFIIPQTVTTTRPRML